MRALVVMPTYDEAENLALVVARLHASQPQVDVLVVDDASPDGTGRIADDLAESNHWVHVLHRPGKQGLGAAYRAGFAWGLERDYDHFVEMDADGSHLPEELVRLLTAASEGADLVIGSRWIDGGSVVNWPRYRRFISRAGTMYARLMLGLPVHDSTAGYRVYQRHTLERLDLAAVASQGYCFQIDMTRRVHAVGMTTVEVPVTFLERERGHSKMSGDIVREALWRVTAWGLARLVPGHRRRIEQKAVERQSVQ
ncbi:MAG: polyprenol monophosphomannose synthase [Aeromicrobium sp.]